MTTSESKGRFFYKTNRIESIRIANWNALLGRGLAAPPQEPYPAPAVSPSGLRLKL